MSAYHVPVMLHECIEGLNINPQGIYIDVTFGGGGHSTEILNHLTTGHLYGFDQDEDAEKNIINNKNFTFVRSNFRFLKNFMKYHNVEHVDGILADLGVSSHHFDEAGRGFSFRFNEEKLDMRMNQRASSNAADILNTYPEDKLASVLYKYGELKDSRRMAAEIIKRRSDLKFDTISSLVDALKPFLLRDREKKELAKVFQALRIEVNSELVALEEMLYQSLDLLKPGGRLVVMTYHSLEDRIVKNFLKTGNFEGKSNQDFYGNFLTPFKLINNKVIVPGDDEQSQNPRSRSAKLRIAEKK